MSLFKKKSPQFVEMVLNNYQVQVYDSKQDMIHLDVYEGFSAEDAIRLCKNDMKRKKILPNVKPIRFFTTFK